MSEKIPFLILCPPDLDFDEVIANDVRSLHLEMLSDKHCWIGLELSDGRRARIDLWTKRAKLFGKAELE